MGRVEDHLGIIKALLGKIELCFCFLMQQLRTNRQTKLSNTPIYELDPSTFQICFLNSRSLHKHIENVRSDLGICVL